MKTSNYFDLLVNSLKSAGIAALAALMAGTPANAITRGGEPDGNDHPGVGLMVLTRNGVPLSRCSGILISPTVFLTAGHCTYGGNGARVWFEEDVDSVSDYPYGGNTAIEALSVHTHPSYVDSAFFLYDLGVVILSQPKNLFQGEYGVLPSAGLLNQFKNRRGLQDTSFTAVGYGLQQIRPETIGLRKRLQAELGLIDLTGTVGIPEGTSIGLTNNAHTGGTCFGDSGGPIFVNDTNVVGAVTSFGLNGNCAGTGFGYRVDQQDDLSWLGTFLP